MELCKFLFIKPLLFDTKNQQHDMKRKLQNSVPSEHRRRDSCQDARKSDPETQKNIHYDRLIYHRNIRVVQHSKIINCINRMKNKKYGHLSRCRESVV